MSKQIGAREISEYAQKYNMPLGKDTPLSMEWCFEMSDKAYQQGRADAIDEFLELLVDEIAEAEHFIETEDGDAYGLTSNEICFCIERTKQELKEQKNDNQ